MKKLITISLAVTPALFFSSCFDPSTTHSGLSGHKGVSTYRAYDRPASLPKAPSQVRVKVSLKNQMTYGMEGAKPLLVMPVAVGTSSTPTPKGNFRIYYKDADRRAQTHGYATTSSGRVTSYTKNRAAPAGSRKIGTPMPYWCEFASGYGFHTGWLKPYPCTHGCLRMHENLAPKFFKLVKVGTPVNISYSQPEDATIGRNIKRPIDANPLPDYPLSLRMSKDIFTFHKRPRFN